jgi:hypothetical protein
MRNEFLLHLDLRIVISASKQEHKSSLVVRNEFLLHLDLRIVISASKQEHKSSLVVSILHLINELWIGFYDRKFYKLYIGAFGWGHISALV